MMGTLRCDHPDIEAFIDAKRDPAPLKNFNLSVLVTDAFMEAVKEDRIWDLTFGGKIYRSLPARELWDRITRATYEVAEPGVIFIDRINALNNLSYCETIDSTNPDTPTRCAGPISTTPFTSRSTISSRMEEGAPSRFSSTPRTWSTMPGQWR
jgi:ribonucleotide reductase alpha subunit